MSRCQKCIHPQTVHTYVRKWSMSCGRLIETRCVCNSGNNMYSPTNYFLSWRVFIHELYIHNCYCMRMYVFGQDRVRLQKCVMDARRGHSSMCVTWLSVVFHAGPHPYMWRAHFCDVYPSHTLPSHTFPSHTFPWKCVVYSRPDMGWLWLVGSIKL